MSKIKSVKFSPEQYDLMLEIYSEDFVLMDEDTLRVASVLLKEILKQRALTEAVRKSYALAFLEHDPNRIDKVVAFSERAEELVEDRLQAIAYASKLLATASTDSASS